MRHRTSRTRDGRAPAAGMAAPTSRRTPPPPGIRAETTRPAAPNRARAPCCGADGPLGTSGGLSLVAVVKPRAPLAARSTVQSTALYIRDMAAIACTASSPIASTAPARIRRVGPRASAPSRPAPMVGGISMTVNNSRVRWPRIRARAGASADDERPPAPPRSILAGHNTATEGGSCGGVRGCAVAAGLAAAAIGIPTVAHAKPPQPPRRRSPRRRRTGRRASTRTS